MLHYTILVNSGMQTTKNYTLWTCRWQSTNRLHRFPEDTLCRFVAPGPLVLTSHYTKEGDIYIIQINDIVSARLYKTKEGKLRGEAPFFEGIWIIKERWYQQVLYSSFTHFFSYKESICQPPKKSITKIQYKSNKMNKDCYPYMEKEQKEDEQNSM